MRSEEVESVWVDVLESGGHSANVLESGEHSADVLESGEHRGWTCSLFESGEHCGWTCWRAVSTEVTVNIVSVAVSTDNGDYSVRGGEH